MKTFRLCLALVVSSLAFAQLARAGDNDKHHPGKPAKCCAKSSGEGKSCTHGCCAEAAKAGKNCEKCGGTNVDKPEKAS